MKHISLKHYNNIEPPVEPNAAAGPRMSESGDEEEEYGILRFGDAFYDPGSENNDAQYWIEVHWDRGEPPVTYEPWSTQWTVERFGDVPGFKEACEAFYRESEWVDRNAARGKRAVSQLFVLDLEWHDLAYQPISQIACVRLDSQAAFERFILNKPLHRDWKSLLGCVQLSKWDDERIAVQFDEAILKLLGGLKTPPPPFAAADDDDTEETSGATFLFFGTTDERSLLWSIKHQTTAEGYQQIVHMLREKRPRFVSASKYIYSVLNSEYLSQISFLNRKETRSGTLQQIYETITSGAEPPAPSEVKLIDNWAEIQIIEVGKAAIAVRRADDRNTRFQQFNASSTSTNNSSGSPPTLLRVVSTKRSAVTAVFHDATTDALALQHILTAVSLLNAYIYLFVTRTGSVFERMGLDPSVANDRKEIQAKISANTRYILHSLKLISEEFGFVPATPLVAAEVDKAIPIAKKYDEWIRQLEIDDDGEDDSQQLEGPPPKHKASSMADATKRRVQQLTHNRTPSKRSDTTTDSIFSQSTHSSSDQDLLDQDLAGREQRWRDAPDRPIWYVTMKDSSQFIIHCKHCPAVLEFQSKWRDGQPRFKANVCEIPSTPPQLQTFIFCKACKKYEGDEDDASEHSDADEEEPQGDSSEEPLEAPAIPEPDSSEELALEEEEEKEEQTRITPLTQRLSPQRRLTYQLLMLLTAANTHSTPSKPTATTRKRAAAAAAAKLQQQQRSDSLGGGGGGSSIHTASIAANSTTTFSASLTTEASEADSTTTSLSLFHAAGHGAAHRCSAIVLLLSLLLGSKT